MASGRLSISLIVLSTLAFTGCADHVTAPSSSKTQSSPSFEIQDAAHSAGKAGFYFLPPMVAQPNYSGAFDGEVSPEVQVCAWTSSSCDTIVADFTPMSGTGGETVHLDAAGEKYQANWDTKTCTWGSCQLDTAKIYRIRTLANSVELGHADVRIVSNGAGLKNVQTGEYIGLVDGRTLPVKFRVETGIIATVAVSPSEASIATGATQAFSATVKDLHGTILTGLTPSWTTGNSSVASIDAHGVATGISVGASTVLATVSGVQGIANLTVVPSGPVGTIAFLSTRGTPAGQPSNDVYIMNANGSNVHRLTVTPGDQEEFPDLSPDKSSVIFGRNYEIFSIKADGTGERQLTAYGAVTRTPSFSPDGRHIAFYSNRSGEFDLWIMDADGSNARQLTTGGSGGFWPSWSPDGSRVVYTGLAVQQLFVVEVATGISRQVTFSAGGGAYYPHWAPQGSRVAYVDANEGTTWIIDVDLGTPAFRVTTPGFSDGAAAWSPDGQQLLIGGGRTTSGPYSQLSIINVDGTGLAHFLPTDTGADDGAPSWRP